MARLSLWETIRDVKPSPPSYLPVDYPDLTGKNVLITGTSAGVGYEASKLLLAQNATVIMFNRNQKKTEDAILKMKQELIEQDSTKYSEESLANKVISIIGDLSDLRTIKPAIDQFKQDYKDKIPNLDIVILNAGVMQPPNGSITEQGYELQFGTNCIGHQLLVNQINDLVIKSTSIHPGSHPRVIWLSSLAHAFSPQPKCSIPYSAGLSWDFKDSSSASSMTIYGQSKAGNVYQAAQYGELNKEKGVISLAVHPGFLNSELQRHYSSIMAFFASKVSFPPIYGAYTELYAALNEKDIKFDENYQPGDYYGPWGTKRVLRNDIDQGRIDGTAKKLWDFIQDEIKEYL